jgi:hypothetical protein
MIAKDHPELNITPEPDENGIKQYQSLISALQWLVTLGCFDILIAVTTMSGYYIAPREGHLECLQRIKRQPDGVIHFRPNTPDHEAYHIPKKFDWSSSIYGNAQEDVLHDMPAPKGIQRCKPIS